MPFIDMKQMLQHAYAAKLGGLALIGGLALAYNAYQSYSAGKTILSADQAMLPEKLLALYMGLTR